jgi:Holliday junction resolvase RusA-like endonuclease
VEGRKTSAVIEFTVPGRPVPAVRMTQRGKWIKPNAARYLAYKQQVGWTARPHFPAPFEGPVGIEIDAYIANKRPGDLDNIIKALQDGLNGIAWLDDRQVVEIRARRHHGGPERAEIKIWRVTNGS